MMSTTCRVERFVVLPGSPRSAGEARRFVRTVLVANSVADEVVDTAALLVSELVTNAVLHAGTAVTVGCTVQPGASSQDNAGPGVLVEVSDGSRLLPRPRSHHREAVTGRGLELVELLAEHSGQHRTPTGKSVWFSLAGAPPPAEPVAIGHFAPDDPTVEVLLRGVPVRLQAVLQEHNESLLREYEMYRLAEPTARLSGDSIRLSDDDSTRRSGDDCSRQDITAADRARVRVATAVHAVATGAVPGDSVAGDPPPRLDVTLEVPLAEVAAYERLVGVLDCAEAAAVAGRLLTRPALPELLALRDWLFGQVVDQAHGQLPVVWSPVVTELPAPAASSLVVDLAWVRRTAHAVVVGDDANRIIDISDAAAELLGWARENLVGRRITAIIPARFHEAHVTGFTRQLVTGRETLIGREVAVPALHRNGHEVPVLLRLERAAADHRTMYLGWLGLAGSGAN